MQNNLKCISCPLYNNNFKNYVPPEYPSNENQLDILFVGEAPGETEVKEKRPFVGKSGNLFRRVLMKYKIPSMFKIGITNVVKCRPPNNRTPTKTEIELCKGFLEREILSYNPRLIVGLGNVPLRALAKINGIKKNKDILMKIDIKGKTFDFVGTYHPAYVLRSENLLGEFEASFQKILNILSGMNTGEDLEIILVKTKKDLEEAFNYFTSVKRFAFDFETTSKYLYKGKPFLISLSTKDKCFLFPLNNLLLSIFDIDEITVYDSISIVKTLLEDETIEKYAHGGKFDILWAKYLDINVKNYSFDTLLAHYLLNPNLRHSLESILLEFGISNFKGEFYDQVGRSIWERIQNNSINKKELESVLEYNAKDSWSVFIITEKLREQISNQKNSEWILNNLLLPASQVFADIEFKGMKVDINRLKFLEKEFEDRINTIVSEIRNMEEVKFFEKRKGSIINLNSTQHLQEVLYEILKLKAPHLTQKGSPSTDKVALEKLSSQSLFASRVLEYRNITKLLKTFIKGLEGFLVKDYIHPTYRLHGTVTGRLSCSDPNIQQIPKTSDIRKVFIPRFDYILEADYSQVELRVVAFFSKEVRMLEAFENNLDLHSYTASLIFSKPIDQITKEERSIAKTINFGIIYGMGALSLAERLTMQGRPTTEQEAENFIRSYFNNFYYLHRWIENQKVFVSYNHYTYTPFGRVRYFMKIDNETKRQAVNSPVQSTASDLTLSSIIRLHKEISSLNLKSCIIGTVHDSIIFDVVDSELEILYELIKRVMETPPIKELEGLPLRVDIAIGENWGELEDI